MSATIIYPSQGKNVVAFQATAYHAAREIYHSKATVFKTVFTKPKSVAFVIDTYATPGGHKKAGFWDAVAASSTFVVVSHMGYDDGPILDYGEGAFQPWGVVPQDTKTLNDDGKQFWSQVTRGRTGNVKIILLGCHSGVTYANAVSKVGKCEVFGIVDSAAAADWASMKPFLQAIHAGREKKGMVKVTG